VSGEWRLEQRRKGKALTDLQTSQRACRAGAVRAGKAYVLFNLPPQSSIDPQCSRKAYTHTSTCRWLLIVIIITLPPPDLLFQVHVKGQVVLERHYILGQQDAAFRLIGSRRHPSCGCGGPGLGKSAP
jgi:hypothetical protein